MKKIVIVTWKGLHFYKYLVFMGRAHCIKTLLFLLKYLGITGCLFAQPFAFQHLSVEQGLPNYSVISLAQDKTGFLWMGTTAGLCRYDGSRIKIYKSQPARPGTISDDHIMSLCADSKGRLWAGSPAGVDIYDAQYDRFKQLKINGAATGAVYCIFEDSKKQVWVGTINGLLRLGKNAGERAVIFLAKENNKGIAGNVVKAVFEDDNGRIWAGTDKGLSRIEALPGNRFRFTSYTLEPAADGIKKESAITAIAAGPAGRLWVGTQGSGLYLFDTLSGKSVAYKSRSGDKNSLVNNNIRCITRDSKNRVWIGTQEGISILSPGSNRFTNLTHAEQEKESLSQNSVYNILEDKNGSIWVATYFGGVSIAPAYQTPFATIQSTDKPNSLSNNVISSMVEDAQGNLWIGTEGGGINYFNRASGNFKVHRHTGSTLSSAAGLGSNLVKVVYIDKEQNVWAGTHGGGLNVLAAGQDNFKSFIIDPARKTDNEITSIAEDNDGLLWTATNSGLKLFEKAGSAIVPAPYPAGLPGGIPHYLYKDKTGAMWIAMQAGLHRISNKIAKEIDSSITVNCFAEDNKGQLWLGSKNKGLAKFDLRSSRLVYVTVPDLSAYNIVGILPSDAGHLWLSTDKGLIHLLPGADNYQLYTKSDGLAGNGFNYNSYLKDSYGNMYFGGFNGITRFFPNDIKINTHIPSIVFTGIKVENKEIAVNDALQILKKSPVFAPPLSFAYNQNLITIEFALLNFIKSDKNKYAYKLEGFDNDWTETATASATYTKLPAGRYRFMLKGANNDGLWTKPIALEITIRPPFWLTWWAYCIYVLLAAALVFIIARFFFMRALLKREDELHTAKLNFFTNVSHEIRTHLALIMAPVERIITENGENNFIQQQLTQVKANTHRLLKLVSELMDFRKAESNHLELQTHTQDLISFLQKIYESFRDTAQAKNISTSFVHEQEAVAVDFDEEQLEKVFFNLLANAVKFTPEGGSISLYACERNGKAIVTVMDNGRGIAPEYLQKLFTNFFQVADHGLQNTGYGIGLALAKNIVTLHKGTISVESIPAEPGRNGKTTFTVSLPVSIGNASIKPAKPRPEPLGFFAPAKAAGQPRNKEQAQNRQTILVVEDNPDMAALIKENLCSYYTVLTAANGISGWDCAIMEIPDLIISDIMMPDMDGYAFCKKIKTDERTSHIPVILLTAKSSQKEQISGLQQGADVYLTKPFSVQVLLLSIQNLLSSRERVREKLTKELSRFHIHTSPENTQADALFSNPVDKEFLEKVMGLVDEHLDDPEFGVEMLSRKVAMSVPVLYKKLRALTNMSVNEFIKLQRFKKAAELLAQKRLTVNEVSFAVGYDDRKYFSREFKKYFGVLPSEYEGAIRSV